MFFMEVSLTHVKFHEYLLNNLTKLFFMTMTSKEMTKPNYSWQTVFDAVKKLNGEVAVIEIKSRHKFKDPKTPRTLKGYSYFYAKYDSESDAIDLWAYTDKTREYRDPEDGYWGMETEREMWRGVRNRNGDWIIPLTSVWGK